MKVIIVARGIINSIHVKDLLFFFFVELSGMPVQTGYYSCNNDILSRLVEVGVGVCKNLLYILT